MGRAIAILTYADKRDCWRSIATSRGGLTADERMFVDFSREPNGPVRAHEIRYPGGDCTSDSFT
jgi:hypothetical protein